MSAFTTASLVAIAAAFLLACSQDEGTSAQPERLESTSVASVDAGGPTPVADVDAVTVVYDDEGFSPKRLEIDLGEAVRFVNESGSSFWPASNIHPTHEIYPAFDAKGPVPAGESWIFAFDGVGFWRYHNHLDPARSGLVVVRGDSTAQAAALPRVDPSTVSFKQVGAVSPEEAINLFRDDTLLTRFVKEYGPAATVGLLAEYESRVEDCHQRAHVMGRIAYELFGSLAFSLSGHECHAGGYHGATEAFFRDRGTTSLRSDVAVVCGDSLNGFFRHQCVHGIGHGLMAWTSYELFDALELCEVLELEVDQHSCYSGVFMENVVGGLSGVMGHFTEFLSEDPHFPCNVVEERHVAHCYYFQTSRAVQLFNGDFSGVAKTCEEAPPAAQRLCFLSMGRDVGGVSRDQPQKAIGLCATVQGRANRIDCLEGAVQDSFWDVGGADNALAFCGLLDDHDEKARCYFTIVTRAHDIYQGAAELQGFCARVEEGYRQDCP